MSYQSLYRTYRPRHFEEVVGQAHIKRALQNAIKRQQLAHAYLFCGPRGTGKTSVAKIFAQGINCEHPDKAPCGECSICQSFEAGNHPDIIEIDAASNNGVDEIRDLIEKTKYAPLELTYKVYIIDEVHMLTSGAFNALLKTLEEPPEHVVFILATTEVHKVLPTIISRTQRYDFERVSQQDIKSRLEIVLAEEKINAEEGVLDIIASLADGGMRDALTITEQVIAFASDGLSVKDVLRVYKVVGAKEKVAFIEAILKSDLNQVLTHIKDFDNQSIEFKRFINDLITMLKEASIYSLTKQKEFITPIQLKETVHLSDSFKRDQLLLMIDEFLKVTQDATMNGLYQDYLEIASIKLCHQFDTGTAQVVNEPVTPKAAVIEPAAVIEKVVQPVTERVNEPMTNQESVVTHENNSSNDDFLIERMVMGNKQLKEQEIERWPQMKDYENDYKYRRVSPYLNNSVIAISDEEHLVVVLERSEEAALINGNQPLVSEVVEKVLGTNKIVTAVTVEVYKAEVARFRKLYEAKKLPSKQEIQKKQETLEVEEVNNEPSTTEVLSDFFGDSLSIIE